MMPDLKKLTTLKCAVSFLLWIYIIYRAVFISITQDEAHSYLLAKTYNWKQMAGTTNTHWLNTFFMRLMLYLPGNDAMWKLRMFSILSWGLYSWSTIKLSQGFRNKWLGFLFFSALVFNPFIVFYFSLERGYAPAFALVMLSLYLCSVQISRNEFYPTKWTPAFLAAAFASLSNFSAYYFFLALTVLFVIMLAIKRQLSLLLTSYKWLLVTAFVSLFTIAVLLFVRSRNELYYGGTNLIESMIGSMLQGSYYIDHHFDKYYTEGIAYLLSMKVFSVFKYAGIVLVVALVFIFLSLGKTFLRERKLTLSFLTTTICLLIFFINGFFHFLFGTPYLFARTALIIFPILTTASFFFLDTYLKIPEKNRLSNFFIAVISFGLIYNYSESFSLKSFVEWPVQTQTIRTLNFLEKNKTKMAGLNIWDYSVLANYYSIAYPKKYRFKYSVLSLTDDKRHIDSNTLKQCAYIVLVPPYDSIILKKWKLVEVLPFSKTMILKRP